MQNRRVGTLTFGFLLIVLGIIYFIASVFNIQILSIILSFWPLILISLGIEVLILNKISLKNNVPLRYDIISFILIIIIFFFAFGTFTVCTGVKHLNNTNYYFKF